MSFHSPALCQLRSNHANGRVSVFACPTTNTTERTQRPGQPGSRLPISHLADTDITSGDAFAGGTSRIWACCGSADGVLAQSASRYLTCHASAYCQYRPVQPHQTGCSSHEHLSPAMLHRERRNQWSNRRDATVSSSFFLQRYYRSPRSYRDACFVSWSALFLLHQRLMFSTSSDVSIDSPNCRLGSLALCSSWSAPHARWTPSGAADWLKLVSRLVPRQCLRLQMRLPCCFSAASLPSVGTSRLVLNDE